MRNRSLEILRIAVVACLVVMACGPKRSAIIVAGEKGQTPTSEVAVAEVVVRHLLVNLPPGEEVFVSFGATRNDPVDPPEGFLERLGDIPAAFHPVSVYRERENHMPLLLVVHTTRWVGETVAEVTAVRFRCGVGAADGFTATVTWASGHWRLSEKRKSWSS